MFNKVFAAMALACALFTNNAQAQTCAADEFSNGNDCVKTCPAGKVTLDRKCVTPAEKCTERGWSKPANGNVCHFGNSGPMGGFYELADIAGIANINRDALCNLGSGSSEFPECATVFGPNYEFPQIPDPHSRRTYIYNCDPSGTRGLMPATYNVNGATNCTCAEPSKVRRGATSRVINGATVMLGGQCECPEGMVENDNGMCIPRPANAPSHAPSVTRPVAADFVAETFTLFWRPPAQNTGAPITGYRIFREQNAKTQPTAHPTVCNSANFSVSLEDHAFTLTDPSEWFQHTVHPLGNPPTAAPGSTHGKCYRWQIAAVNQHGTGPTTATVPILSRGFVVTEDGEQVVRAYDTTRTDNSEEGGGARVPCPTGEYGVYGYKGDWGVGCAPPQSLGQAETCHALRDRNPALASAHRETFCGIEDMPASSTICADLGFTDLGEVEFYKNNELGSLERCEIADPCSGTFSEYNADHRECLCAGWATPKASGNGCECTTAGADDNCECPGPVGATYLVASNACGCPEGQEIVSGACVPQGLRLRLRLFLEGPLR